MELAFAHVRLRPLVNISGCDAAPFWVTRFRLQRSSRLHFWAAAPAARTLLSLIAPGQARAFALRIGVTLSVPVRNVSK